MRDLNRPRSPEHTIFPESNTVSRSYLCLQRHYSGMGLVSALGRTGFLPCWKQCREWCANLHVLQMDTKMLTPKCSRSQDGNCLHLESCLRSNPKMNQGFKWSTRGQLWGAGQLLVSHREQIPAFIANTLPKREQLGGNYEEMRLRPRAVSLSANCLLQAEWVFPSFLPWAQLFSHQKKTKKRKKGGGLWKELPINGIFLPAARQIVDNTYFEAKAPASFFILPNITGDGLLTRKDFKPS